MSNQNFLIEIDDNDEQVNSSTFLQILLEIEAKILIDDQNLQNITAEKKFLLITPITNNDSDVTNELMNLKNWKILFWNDESIMDELDEIILPTTETSLSLYFNYFLYYLLIVISIILIFTAIEMYRIIRYGMFERNYDNDMNIKYEILIIE
ncbi:hypothetical protein HUG17_0502 [Dermatophagoides farinae]|uniref:Uncharacterized protein n=1 Tax=Dermatophagoides farinae TaxID=6954 RepID=A0A9D4SJL5_DERFA|nr:hypothetical protein HUG17_0502 [Dermatophagoides farinae]